MLVTRPFQIKKTVYTNDRNGERKPKIYSNISGEQIQWAEGGYREKVRGGNGELEEVTAGAAPATSSLPFPFSSISCPPKISGAPPTIIPAIATPPHSTAPGSLVAGYASNSHIPSLRPSFISHSSSLSPSQPLDIPLVVPSIFPERQKNFKILKYFTKLDSKLFFSLNILI